MVRPDGTGEDREATPSERQLNDSEMEAISGGTGEREALTQTVKGAPTGEIATAFTVTFSKTGPEEIPLPEPRSR